MRDVVVEREATVLSEGELADGVRLSASRAQEMAEFFKTLADANRLRLLSVLTTGEMCVGDLAARLDMSESAVSHQLRLLRVMRLVRYRKVGRKVFYTLDDNHILDLYQTVEAHLNESRDT